MIRVVSCFHRRRSDTDICRDRPPKKRLQQENVTVKKHNTAVQKLETTLVKKKITRYTSSYTKALAKEWVNTLITLFVWGLDQLRSNCQ